MIAMTALLATVLPNVGPIDVLEKFVADAVALVQGVCGPAADLVGLQRLGGDLEDVAAQVLLLTFWILASA